MSLARLLLPLAAILAARAQSPEPKFYSWHAIEFIARDTDKSQLAAQIHFRTRHHFSTFNLIRGSIYGNRKLPRGWIWGGGYFAQRQEQIDLHEFTGQQRVFTSLSRDWTTGRFRHTPRLQYDYLFAMPVPSYGRYRFGWQTEFASRIRPYAGAEEFIEHAGHQRFRPRAGIRFHAGHYVETDIGYIYDRIRLRGDTNRHILQTTFSFHSRRPD